ncbi:hypothetical protein EON63_05175 [archaeon]|nr:MAG: hypothetical protein EON63_05175 [archaeon]
MYVPDPPLHSFWHRTRDPAELPDQHNPERTEFFQLFGRQVLDVTTMIDLDSVKRFPTIDKTIWFLFHYCPSLVAMPFRREINSTSLTYFSKYSMVMLKEVSYSISDVNMLQCLFDENNAVLINLPQSQNKLEDISMLFDHNRLAPSIFTERSIPIILAIFQRCPCLHSLSIDRVLKWRRTSDFSLLSFYFPASLAIYQWVSFLDDLADCLPTITRVELQLTRGESYSTSMDPYILTVFQKLQTAPCFATVRHMTLAGGMAQVSDVSMYVLPNIAHVEITYMLIPEASLLTHLATSSLLLCFPNVKTLHINYFSTLSHNGSGFCTAIMGAIDLLPCLDELIIVDSASYLTDHFIHALASKGRVWKTLDFSIRQSDFLALQATRVSLRAAMLQGLLVVKKLVLRETHLKVIESLGYGRLPIAMLHDAM